MKTKNKGFILGAVLCIIMLTVIITASLCALINTQRKLSLKKELMLQADNAAETALDYAYSCIINDIQTNSIRSAKSLPASGFKSFTFGTAPANFLTGTTTMDSGYAGQIANITYSAPVVRVGAVGSAQRYYVDPSDPANANDTSPNNWEFQQLIPVVAQVTASQSGNSYTAYVQKSIASVEVDLFQYAIFFQGQLHMHRGFRPMGPVHTNGNLFLNAHDGDKAIYNGAISAAGHIYRGSTFDQSGTGSDGYGYVPIVAISDVNDANYGKPDFTKISPHSTGNSSPDLRIYVKDDSSGNPVYQQYGGIIKNSEGEDSFTDPNGWSNYANSNFGNQLTDKSTKKIAPSIKLVGAVGYDYGNDKVPFCNGPYDLLEPTFPSTSAYDAFRCGYNGTAGSVDNSNNLEANASLILIVEYNNDGSVPITLHRISDGATVTIAGGVITAMSATPDPDPVKDTVGARPTLSGSTYSDPGKYSDPWRMFVLKGYKVLKGWDATDKTLKDIHDYLYAITLPDNVFGAANYDPTIPGSGGPTGSTAAGSLYPSKVATSLKMEDFDVYLYLSSTQQAETMAQPLNGSATVGFYNKLSSSDKTKFNDTSSSGTLKVQILKGLFDSRLGRGVAPLTIDIDALKDIMEAPIANLTAGSNNRLFRTDFDPATAASGAYKQWNGLIYIEFPTSLSLPATDIANSKNGINTLRFAYATAAETRHPDRSDVVDTHTTALARTDHIVPIAPELRRYPPAATANLNSTILDAQYAIPAVQLINARYLPNPTNAAGNGGTNNANLGFSIATNVPIYIVGNYNADGDYTTPANLTSTVANDYATAETGEIPAALYCDTLTTLSNGWGLNNTTTGLSNRSNSFYGNNKGSDRANGTTVGSVGAPPGRPARGLAGRNIPHFTLNGGNFAYPDSNPDLTQPYVEIAASIATGEYPIFEFFNHALENYTTLYNNMGSTGANPIIFKGSVVGMFHSEIQHIKQAYGRSITSDVQNNGDPTGAIWEQHGASAIAGTRFNKFLADGKFPPGTPKAYSTSQKGFTLLHWSDSQDAATLTSAGFSP